MYQYSCVNRFPSTYEWIVKTSWLISWYKYKHRTASILIFTAIVPLVGPLMRWGWGKRWLLMLGTYADKGTTSPTPTNFAISKVPSIFLKRIIDTLQQTPGICSLPHYPNLIFMSETIQKSRVTSNSASHCTFPSVVLYPTTITL